MPLEHNNAVDEKVLSDLLSKIDFKLPIGYLEFMRRSNGAEGELNNYYVVLWPAEELIFLNEEYAVDEFAPGFFIIGSNGGDTAFAIDKQSGGFYEMPFIGMSRDEAKLLASDFRTFLNAL